MRLPESNPFCDAKLSAPGKRISANLFLLRSKHLPSDLAEERSFLAGIVFGRAGAWRRLLQLSKLLLDDTILEGMKRKDAAPPAFVQETWQVGQEFLKGFQFSVDGNSEGQKHAGCRMNSCTPSLTWKGSQDGLDEFPGR